MEKYRRILVKMMNTRLSIEYFYPLKRTTFVVRASEASVCLSLQWKSMLLKHQFSLQKHSKTHF